MKNLEKELLRNQKELLYYAVGLTHNLSSARKLLRETTAFIMCNADDYIYNKDQFLAWALDMMKSYYYCTCIIEQQRKASTEGYDDTPEDNTPHAIAEPLCKYGNDTVEFK